jgi:2-keto-3-deoxy-L-rhamnonate aldolase RhmA
VRREEDRAALRSSLLDEPVEGAQTVDRVASEAGRAGKSAGIMVARREDIAALARLGYRFFTTSDRALVLESARTWREALPARG